MKSVGAGYCSGNRIVLSYVPDGQTEPVVETFPAGGDIRSRMLGIARRLGIEKVFGGEEIKVVDLESFEDDGEIIDVLPFSDSEKHHFAGSYDSERAN
jgi:hypothetical protein